MTKNLYMNKIGKRAKIAALNLSNININKRNSVLKQFSQYLKINSKLICKPSKSKNYLSDSDVAYQAIDKLIKSKVKFDAIYATNDYLAMGCYQAAKENKLSIPKDFSIIGYDNSITATNLKPSLSSIQLPIAEMTEKAIQHIFDDKNYDENFKIFVDCNLVARHSI